MQFAIRTEGLSCNYGAVHAVSDLDLEVSPGTVFGFLGPNGAGKTTTIHLLLGLLAPTEGSATVLGYDTCTQAGEIRARSGALLEHSGLYERMSAEDNLELFARIWHLPAAKRRARAKELLTDLGLWERRKERVGAWSRGMKQRLAVARSLIHRPSLIFLDEPTAGLDPVAAAALRDDLASLAAQEGTTIFLTTHNLVEAEKLCSLVGVIRQGRLLAVGHPDELGRRSGGHRAEILGRGFGDKVLTLLKTRPEVSNAAVQNGRLIIDLHGDAELAPLISLIVAGGGEVEEVRKGRASLEEAFLTLVQEGEER